MIRRRRCLGLRVRTSWICFVPILCLAAILILYRRLSLSSSHQKTNTDYVPFEDSQAFRDSFRHNLDESNLILKNKFGAGLDVGKYKHDRNLQNFKLDSEKYIQVVKFLYQLYPTDWGNALDPNEMAIELKHFLADLDIYSDISCQDIDLMSSISAAGLSKKKYIELSSIDSKDIILKSQNVDENVQRMCLKTNDENEFCETMGNYKLMREILYLSLLKHPQIISMLGFCLRSGAITTDIKKKGIILLTENATPRNIGSIPFLRWARRLKFAKQLASLLIYLQFSPLGSLGLDKFNSDDILVVEQNHQLKLVDLDEVRFTEKPCTTAYHCLIDDQQFGVKCVDKKCQNYNAKLNLYHVGKQLLDPLLRNSPHDVSKEMNALLDRLSFLKISAEEIYDILNKIKIDEEDLMEVTQRPKDEETEHFQRRNFGGSNDFQEHNHPDQHSNNLPDDNGYNPRVVAKPKDMITGNYSKVVFQSLSQGIMSELPLQRYDVRLFWAIWDDHYIRYDESNYPGMYDYKCPGSRVTWGCVMTVNGLKQAIQTCNIDPVCQSFVLFTTLPETTGLVTAVFKNGYATRPENNVGATLFVKKRKKTITESPLIPEKVVTLTPLGQMGSSSLIKSSNATIKMTKAECVQKVRSKSKDARVSRERRLMTHLGLKGMKEKEWLTSVKEQDVFKNRGFYPVPSPLSRGGKFLIDFNKSKSKEVKYVKRALFSAVHGPHYYHIAQLISYNLDRLLGLYHIPPTQFKIISKEELDNFKTDSTWDKYIGPVIDTDGSLKGIVSVPIPKVMKADKLTISPLEEMVNKPKNLTRTERIQIEYVFIWWITKLFNQKNMHNNYKGHFVHFNSDRAFQDIGNDLIGYFYHCQFPNIVYKALLCFKCSAVPGQPGPIVCNLAKEIFKMLEKDDINVLGINIAGSSKSDITVIINDAATLVVSIVERCIKRLGRENVLY